MKNKKWIIMILLFWTSANAQTKNREYYLDISKALGFSYGVERTNTLIQEKYSDLSKKSMLAQLEFNLAHNNAIEAIENEMSIIMKKDKTEFKNQIISQISEQVDLNNFSHLEADEYLRNFNDERIFGRDDLYNNFVQILLRHNPRYIMKPIKEFQGNYRELFKSKNHPKSKGLELTIEYPTSWTKQEGKRPNILQLINSYDKSCNLTILIKDIFDEMEIDKSAISSKELEYIYSDEFANKMVEEVFTFQFGKEVIDEVGLENISDYEYEKTKIDGQPAIIVKASGDLKRGIVDTRVYTINYYIMYRNYMVNVSFMITSFESKLTEKREKFELLCELIARSLIFSEKW